MGVSQITNRETLILTNVANSTKDFSIPCGSAYGFYCIGYVLGSNGVNGSTATGWLRTQWDGTSAISSALTTEQIVSSVTNVSDGKLTIQLKPYSKLFLIPMQ